MLAGLASNTLASIIVEVEYDLVTDVFTFTGVPASTSTTSFAGAGGFGGFYTGSGTPTSPIPIASGAVLDTLDRLVIAPGLEPFDIGLGFLRLEPDPFYFGFNQPGWTGTAVSEPIPGQEAFLNPTPPGGRTFFIGGIGAGQYTLTLTSVPEASEAVVVIIGVLGLVGSRRRKHSA